MDSSIYIIRLLLREQHSVLFFRTCIASVAEIFYFFISFGIPYQVDPRKWDISSTHVIQHLKPSASCFSHESSIRTSNTKPDESNVIWSHLAHPPPPPWRSNFDEWSIFLPVVKCLGPPPKVSGKKLNFHWSNAVAGQI